MRYSTFSWLLGGAVIASLAALSGANPLAAQLPAGGELREVPPNSKNETFYGTVTAISKDSISIRGMDAVMLPGITRVERERTKTTYYGKPISLITRTRVYKGVKVVGNREGLTITDADGNVTVIRSKDQPISTFKFTKDLASGKTAKVLRPAFSYRPQDVKVGDEITIHYDRIEGNEFCKQISIDRRPGGLVPPAPEDRGEGLGYKYHEWANAQNDWIDKGTPIPDKFLPPWELEERRAKIAPMPHAPRIPEAQP